MKIARQLDVGPVASWYSVEIKRKEKVHVGTEQQEADDDPDDDDASTRTQLLALERQPDGDQTL